MADAQYFTKELSRLTEDEREKIVSSFNAMLKQMPDYANKIFVGFFSEYPEYKDIWPQFRAVPDSSLISCNALQKHTEIYSAGLKGIVDNIEAKNNDGLKVCTKKIAVSHKKLGVTKFHMEKMLPEILSVIRRATSDSSTETAAAWKKLCDVLGNIIHYQMTH